MFAGAGGLVVVCVPATGGAPPPPAGAGAGGLVPVAGAGPLAGSRSEEGKSAGESLGFSLP